MLRPDLQYAGMPTDWIAGKGWAGDVRKRADGAWALKGGLQCHRMDEHCKAMNGRKTPMPVGQDSNTLRQRHIELLLEGQGRVCALEGELQCHQMRRHFEVRQG